MKNPHVDRVEILAPAGSIDCLHAAISAGADAVYMGGTKFGARAYAENPEQEDYLRAIDYVHLHGRKLYLTLNTLLKPNELDRELYDYVRPMAEQGLDGVIVQDAAVFRFLREYFPGLPLHASTQMAITGPEGARAAARMGAVRVVPARELSLEEIRKIREESGLEIEVFVHGALCYCYSGLCLMSSMIGGRSGNRGRCAGTCRLPYQVNGEETYALSMKDLCALEDLPDLIDAGVYSFKIEGRMKSPLYTAGVTEVYRRYADLYLEKGREGYQIQPEAIAQLKNVYDRGGFTDAYFHRHNGRDMMILSEKKDTRQPEEPVLKALEEKARTPVKEEIVGCFRCYAGEKATAWAYLKEDPFVFANVVGAMVTTAKTRAVTKDELARPWLKTGSSAFTWNSFTVDHSDDAFIPMGECSAMRRALFEQLEQMRTLMHRRSYPEIFPGERPRKSLRPLEGTGAPAFLVSVEKEEQLVEALATPEVTGILLDSEMAISSERRPNDPALSDERLSFWRSFVNKCHQSGKKAYLSLPYIFRIQSRVEYKMRWKEITEMGFDGISARTIDEAGFVKEQGFAGDLLGDSSLYTWSRMAREEWESLFGISSFTAPLEVHSRDLSGRGLHDDALVIYGYIPMMVTANCVRQNFGGCTKMPSYQELKDRMGETFPVHCQCVSCYNVIFNSRPLSFLGYRDAVRALAPAALRMNFTVEGGAETRKLLDEYAAVYFRGGEDHVPGGIFTRGHFKKGVE